MKEVQSLRALLLFLSTTRLIIRILLRFFLLTVNFLKPIALLVCYCLAQIVFDEIQIHEKENGKENI